MKYQKDQEFYGSNLKSYQEKYNSKKEFESNMLAKTSNHIEKLSKFYQDKQQSTINQKHHSARKYVTWTKQDLE